MLRVDQRPYKAALQKALDEFEGHKTVGDFVVAFYLAKVEHDHYLNVENVREFLVTLLEAGNVKRARQFVSHIPDSTASRLVVGLPLVGIGLALLFAVALVIGLAIFLWQHFFG